MQNRRRAAAQGLIVAAVALLALPACSITIGAEKIHGRASLFSGMNRETRETVEALEIEERVVAGLVLADDGRDGLARAYLESKGYSAAQIEQRLALVRAKAALAAAAK